MQRRIPHCRLFYEAAHPLHASTTSTSLNRPKLPPNLTGPIAAVVDELAIASLLKHPLCHRALALLGIFVPDFFWESTLARIIYRPPRLVAKQDGCMGVSKLAKFHIVHYIISGGSAGTASTVRVGRGRGREHGWE